MNKKKNGIIYYKTLTFLLRHRIILLVFFVLCLPMFVLSIDFHVSSKSKNRLFYDINNVPHRRAALVLGCAKYTHGRPNIFYQNRINAAAELWQSGKIGAILVSGDNSRKDYDEPTTMKSDLVAKGIPAEYITIDYAGFRTLDSVIRAEQIFGLEEYIVISQPFHCCRAIYIAKQHGQNVIGWCARDVKGYFGIKSRLREILARNKAAFDVLIHKKPKYLGKRESVTYKI